jgi:nucleotide-binding universal stress UspA family protein
MYDTILVTLDGTPSDRAIIEHVKQLAKLAHSRIVLLHVADGWAARTYGPMRSVQKSSKTPPILEKVRAEFESSDIRHRRNSHMVNRPTRLSSGWKRKNVTWWP